MRPNFLILMTDQQSAQMLSCTGNPDLATPAMDSIANRGIRFERAYTPFPVCVPMRASMATGCWPSQLGYGRTPKTEKNNWKKNWVPERALGNMLSSRGYTCVWAGKDKQPNEWGYETLCGYGDVKVADHLVEFLKGRGDQSKPFCAFGIFQNPHNICEWAMNHPLYEGSIPEEPALAEMPLLPPNYAISPDEPRSLEMFCAPGWHEYDLRGKVSPDFWRRYRWAYCRLVEKVDRQIGCVLQALQDAGHSENTIVLLTSDHGEGAGSHQWRFKHALFEECVRVPLLVAGPGIAKGRVDTEHLISNGVDFLPTICDWVELERPVWIASDACSFAGLAQGKDGPSREALVVETELTPEIEHRPKKSFENNARAYYRGDYKYQCHFHGQHREQLHDLRKDPGELVNLASSARYRPLVEDFRLRLKEWCVSHDDPFHFQIPGHAVLSPGARDW